MIGNELPFLLALSLIHAAALVPVSLVPLALNCQCTASGGSPKSLKSIVNRHGHAYRSNKILTLTNLQHLVCCLDGWYPVLYRNCGIDDPVNVRWTSGISAVFCTSVSQALLRASQRHELRLRYLTSLLDLLVGRHLSLCHQGNVHCHVNELGFYVCHLSSTPLAPVEPAQLHSAGFSTSLSKYCSNGFSHRLNHWDLPLRQDRNFDDLLDELQLLNLRALSGPSAPVVA